MDDRFLNALGCLTHGIYVLTTGHEEKINGMILSWLSQISYEPPLITAAVHPKRYSHHLIEAHKAFVVHVLSKNQKAFLLRFKGPDPLFKFSSLEWFKGKTGCPIFKDCLAYLECRVIGSLRPGNHTLFFGEVLEGEVIRSGEPLTMLDYEGTYLGKD